MTATGLPAARRYRLMLGTLALLVGLLALLALIILRHDEIDPAARALLADPTALAPAQIQLLGLAAALPLGCMLASYLLGGMALRLLRIALYLRGLHRYVGRRLRAAAPLYSRGLAPRVQLAPGAPAVPIARLLGQRAPILLMGDAGSGKCLGKDTPVMLADGTIIPVQNVQEGDLLMGPDGQPRRVLSTTVGRGPLYRITPVKGDPWVCNDVHVLTLVNPVTDAVFDIPLNEWVAYHGSRRLADAKLFRVGVDFEERAVEIDPYLAGLWLGDGSTADVAFTVMEDELLDYLLKVAPDYGAEMVYRVDNERGLKHVRLRMGTRGAAGSHTPSILRRVLLTDFRDAEGRKTIPDRYLRNSRENRLRLLAGIIDTDGYYHMGHYEVATKHEHLADQLAYLARSLGFAAHIRPKAVRIVSKGPGNGTTRLYYRVSISGPMDEIPCLLERKRAAVRQQRKNVLRTGFSAEPIGEGDYYGFTLDGDGRFLLGDFTVTHNTTTLLSLAHELSRPRAAARAFLGRGALPVLASLPAYAEEGSLPFVTYVATQVGRYGSLGFAANVPRLLRRGRLLLLCDGLSDAPQAERGRIGDELARAAPARGTTRLVATCTAAPSELVPELSVPGRWQPCRLAPLTPEEIERATLAARPPDAKRQAPDEIRAIRAEARARRLESALANPAFLAAYAALREAGRPIPYGRAALLREAGEAACARVASDDLPAERLIETLGALASALCHADARVVPLLPGERLGEALADWLAYHRPYSPLQHVQSGPLVLAPDVVQDCCVAALRAGLLVVSSDDSSLGFAHALLEASFAAAWLAAADDGASPLDVGLLRPRWTLPTLLWMGTAPQPARVAARLLPLVESGDDARKTVALGADPSRPRADRPTGVALALAAAASGTAAAIAQLEFPAGEVRAAKHERYLREVLDAAFEQLGQSPTPGSLGAAVRGVEAEAGDELATDIAYLAGIPVLTRLARAQLLSILGLLDSPVALAALVAHLADPDPTVRTAVNRGFLLAGTAGIAALQRQLTSTDQRRRGRAREALDATSAALKDSDTAVQQAVRALEAPDPDRRAAAAETLGALRAHTAVESLVARLGDQDARVRLAILAALGKLADPAALPALRERVGHPDPAFRAALAEVLGAYRDPALVVDLLRLLEDGDSRVRTAAATALGRISDERALTALKQRRGDPDPRTQSAVASAMRRHTQI